MAVQDKAKGKAKEFLFAYQAKDKAGKITKGDVVAVSDDAARAMLKRQGLEVVKLKKNKGALNKKITQKEVALFTRQLATMMKAGVPMLQSFEIVARGHENPAVSKLLLNIKSEIETGASLSAAFRSHPKHFDDLYCNLIAAGEAAGILETVLDRLATYQEKMVALKSKIKSALFYPIAVIGVAIIITAVIMIFVIPAFKKVFEGFGANLPAPTLIVIGMSDFMVANWYIVFGIAGGAAYFMAQAIKRSEHLRNNIDRMMLRLPIFGEVIRKAVIARWTGTLATMFAAGVPLVDALSSVAGAAGNYVYSSATLKIQREVSTGASLTSSMVNADVFPNMVTQMAAIGEESGSLDSMLTKVADFYEQEVDDAVEGLSSLMEPLIMVVLGTLIGGMVVAMYLPIFKMGEVV